MSEQPRPGPQTKADRELYRRCLTAEERTAYQLRFVEGLELTKVASAMGVSVGTVKRRLASARQALARATVHDPYLSDYARKS